MLWSYSGAMHQSFILNDKPLCVYSMGSARYSALPSWVMPPFDAADVVRELSLVLDADFRRGSNLLRPAARMVFRVPRCAR